MPFPYFDGSVEGYYFGMADGKTCYRYLHPERKDYMEQSAVEVGRKTKDPTLIKLVELIDQYDWVGNAANKPTTNKRLARRGSDPTSHQTTVRDMSWADKGLYADEATEYRAKMGMYRTNTLSLANDALFKGMVVISDVVAGPLTH